MQRWLVMTAALGATTVAGAKEIDLVVHPTPVLEAEAGSWYEGGVSDPAVVYDAVSGQYVMFFHFPFTPTGDCEHGLGIGRATSTDGLTWEPDDAPLLLPEAGTPASCGLSEPAVLFDGRDWTLWFRAEQEPNLGDCGLDWGCEQAPGIGVARSSDGADFVVDDALALSAPEVYNSLADEGGVYVDMGSPTVVWYGDPADEQSQQRYLYVGIEYFSPSEGIVADIMSAASDDGITWDWQREGDDGLDATFSHGFFDWFGRAADRPAVVCLPGDQTYPFEVFFHGERSGLGDVHSFGIAQGFTPIDWTIGLDSQIFEWDIASGERTQWTGWEVRRVGSDDYLVWFSMLSDPLDRDSPQHIGLAYTADTWDPATLNNGLCNITLEPIDTGETGDSGETGETGDTGPTGGEVRGGGYCGCGQGRTLAALPLLLLLPLGLLRRRR